jgi:hypothetical protein
MSNPALRRVVATVTGGRCGSLRAAGGGSSFTDRGGAASASAALRSARSVRDRPRRRLGLLGFVALLAVAAGAVDAQAAPAITVGSHSVTVAGDTAAKSGSDSSAWQSHSDPHSDGGSGFFSFSVPIAPAASSSSSGDGGPADGSASGSFTASAAALNAGTGVVQLSIAGQARADASEGPKGPSAPVGTTLAASGGAGGNATIAVRLSEPVAFDFSSSVTGSGPDVHTGFDEEFRASHGRLTGPGGVVFDTGAGGSPSASGTLPAGDYQFSGDGGDGVTLCCLSTALGGSESITFS